MAPPPGKPGTPPTSLQGFFLPSPDGDLWITRWLPAMPPRASVLIVPAFAEEMNKCRPMQAMLGRRLAGCGLQTIAVDLHGTGDSAGEFREARTATWQRNLDRVVAWAAETGAPIHGVLGIRFGALLVAPLLARLAGPRRIALWQPIASGELLLKQFLRLRMAGDLLTGGGSETVASLLAELAAGRTLEVAGYELGAGLARDLQMLDLKPLEPAVGDTLVWFEVGPDPGAGQVRALSRVASDHLRDWVARGVNAEGAALAGDTFWNTVELTGSPALVEATAGFFTPLAAGTST